MVSVMSLWLPILLSALAVFLLSSVLHMMLPFHKKDYTKAPGEDGLLDALRKSNAGPGDYMLPHCTREQMKDPAFKEKLAKGPVAIMTVMPPGMGMGKSLTLWFVYCLVVGSIAACVAANMVEAGSTYKTVFHPVAGVAFAAYGLGYWPNVIWYKKSGMTAVRFTIDGLIYAGVTGGIFGTMWPAL